MKKGKSLIRVFGITFFMISLLSMTAQSQELAENFISESVLDGLDRVTGIQFEDNGRLYFWQQNGKVFIIENDEVLPEPLLDIGEEVADYGDHGLLGFVTHPDFRANGYYYVFYGVDRHHLLNFGTPQYSADSTTQNEATIGRLVRYTADESTNFTTTIPGSRKILIGETKETGIPLMHISHGIGSLVFGEDGSLLASVGDGSTFVGWYTGTASEGPHSYAEQGLADGIIREPEDVGSYRSQLLNSLNGKMLRIDPENGNGLASNPYFDESNPRSAQSRVWALGFRNPFKFIRVPETGSHEIEDGNPGVFVVADVGSGDWEEFNVVNQPGQNFGWPIMEGPYRAWGFWVRRATNRDMPNPLFGTDGCESEYFDFHNLFQYQYSEATPYFNICDSTFVVPDNYPTYLHSPPKLTYNNLNFNQPTRTFLPGEDENGELIAIPIDDPVSGIGSDPFEGIAVIGGDFYQGDLLPEQYHNTYFGADFNGWIKSFRFDEEYNVTEVQPICEDCGFVAGAAFDPVSECLYYVKFGGELRKICYGGNAEPEAIIEADQYYGAGPLAVQFSGLQSFDQNEDPLSYFWEFGDGTTSSDPEPNHVYQNSNGLAERFDVRLTVTDTAGASSQDVAIININNTPPNIEITSFEDGRFYSTRGTEILPLEAAVQDAEHDLNDLLFEWQVLFHHNTHFHPDPIVNDQSTTMIVSPTDCNETYWYRVTLKVTDPLGLTAYTEKEIFPNCNPPFFEIKDLDGERTASSINLNWESIQEDGVDRYELQRAENTIHFETIASIPGEGNGQSYQYADTDPIWGRNNYRLKVFHGDGYFEYSNLKTFEWPIPPAIWINPNPTSDLIFIRFENIQETANFELFDISGRKILEEQWNSTGTFTAELSLQALPDGVYVYRVNDGNQTMEGKISVLK